MISPEKKIDPDGRRSQPKPKPCENATSVAPT